MKTANAVAPCDFDRLVETYLMAEKKLQKNPWGNDSKGAAAFAAADKRLETARNKLRDAVANAPWGKNGSVFITERSICLGISDRVRTLYINNLPRVKVKLAYSSRKPWLANVYTVEEGKKMREDLKRHRRAAQIEYMAERAKLLIDLEVFGHADVSDFNDWRYYNGQEGGVFQRQDGIPIAACPALRKVWGSNWFDHVPMDMFALEFERIWDQKVYGAKY